MRGVDRLIEADADVRLGGQVVDLIGAHPREDFAQAGAIDEVAIVQEESGAAEVRVAVEVVDALGVEAAAAADDAMDGIAFGQEQFGQIGAVLAGDSCDEGFSGLCAHRLSPGCVVGAS